MLSIPTTGAPLIQVGAVDDLLIIGSGESVERALDARRGDNRLIDTERWALVSEGGDAPTTYFDAGVLLRLITPPDGAPDNVPLRAIGFTARPLNDSVIELIAIFQVN